MRDGCRAGVIAAAKRLHGNGQSDFTPAEIILQMRRDGYDYADSTIRTHVTSRMCENAPNNHGTTFDDLQRVAHGKYRLKGKRS